jgi:uncharacterized SAM-binding protein YcdF (DUF218 family)
MIRRLIAIVVLVYLLGFVLYTLTLPRPLEDMKTDAIVVPTGAPGRIDRGLALIAGHQAKRLLISGAAPGVRPIDLAIQYKVPLALFACCVDLGHEAVDTRSNGAETAKWVGDHGYKSVRLVTSDWHMARARMELAAALGGDVTVVEDGVQGDAALGVLLVEYNKLLLRRVALWLGIEQ